MIKDWLLGRMALKLEIKELQEKVAQRESQIIIAASKVKELKEQCSKLEKENRELQLKVIVQKKY